MKKVLLTLLLLFTLSGCSETQNPDENIEDTTHTYELVGDTDVVLIVMNEYVDEGILMDGVKVDTVEVQNQIDDSTPGTYQYCYVTEEDLLCRNVHVIEDPKDTLDNAYILTDALVNYQEEITVSIGYTNPSLSKEYYYTQTSKYNETKASSVTNTDMINGDPFEYYSYATIDEMFYKIYTTADHETYDFTVEDNNSIQKFLNTDLLLYTNPVFDITGYVIDGDTITYEVLFDSSNMSPLYSDGYYFLAGTATSTPDELVVSGKIVVTGDYITSITADLTQPLNNVFQSTFGVTIDKYIYTVELSSFNTVEDITFPDNMN